VDIQLSVEHVVLLAAIAALIEWRVRKGRPRE
jgi:hypothetical protein